MIFFSIGDCCQISIKFSKLVLYWYSLTKEGTCWVTLVFVAVLGRVFSTLFTNVCLLTAGSELMAGRWLRPKFWAASWTKTQGTFGCFFSGVFLFGSSSQVIVLEEANNRINALVAASFLISTGLGSFEYLVSFFSLYRALSCSTVSFCKLTDMI